VGHSNDERTLVKIRWGMAPSSLQPTEGAGIYHNVI
jgi:hypothetical protein